ncbi:MAG: hypothetical protein F4065_11150 [Rhodothermaceae bacterium]|nr:hypothetical protein [Rhodothermaceae bacterium]MXZ17204.1 hypothetical protein [Rhodothermaceae bacterium]MXZ57769.1 hypothetical protein [Rhodothermaceae bacterium]MYB91719.1 hypothetical protein [Rhodothermaceae bacterium]MYD67567.1 hypothetical protein [Rhodothermaceae bacterium]
MGKYQLSIERTALKQLRKIPDHDRRSISSKVDKLKDCARPPGSRQLKGKLRGWRLRYGAHRIPYDIDSSAVTIRAIKRRDSAYR